MPGYDGTGPGGLGAMTGGGRGNCCVSGGYVRSGYAGLPGSGRGRRNMFYAAGLRRWQRNVLPPAGEKEMLKDEAEILKKELAHIQDRIDVLEKEHNDK